MEVVAPVVAAVALKEAAAAVGRQNPDLYL